MPKTLVFVVVTAVLVGAVLYVLRGMARAAGIFHRGAPITCAACGHEVDKAVPVEGRGELCEACYAKWRDEQHS